MKSKYILIAAVIMAIITTILFRQYVVSIDNKYKKAQQIVTVVVPKADIKENKLVTADMLELKEVSKAAVHEDAAKTIDEIAGKYAVTDLEAGEILLKSRVTSANDESSEIARKITSGYRAVAVGVTEVEAVGKMIEPEDYVDIISSVGNGTDAQTVTLLENVRVLAVGKTITDTASTTVAASSSTSSSKADEYTSITVEVKQQDIVRLVNADEKGNIKFVLRSQLTN